MRSEKRLMIRVKINCYPKFYHQTKFTELSSFNVVVGQQQDSQPRCQYWKLWEHCQISQEISLLQIPIVEKLQV